MINDLFDMVDMVIYIWLNDNGACNSDVVISQIETAIAFPIPFRFVLFY